MADIQERVKKGEPLSGEYLTHLLMSEQMSVHEVLGSITELLLAGVDTVRESADMEKWKGTCTHTYTHMHMQEHVYAYINTYPHTGRITHTHMHTHAHTLAE